MMEERTLAFLPFDPTEGQRRLFHVFGRFAVSPKPRCVMLVKGYAGTGKTTSVQAMVKAVESFGLKVVLLAPTGRAAKVLSHYAGRPASTIHRHIYYKRSDKSGKIWFELKENKMEDTIFMVDEASMIGSDPMNFKFDDLASGDVLDDLITHVFSGERCKLMFIGDVAQLPPVGSDQSPALLGDSLRLNYDLFLAEIQLTEVIRQAQDSGILFNATLLRYLIVQRSGELPKFSLTDYDDVIKVDSDIQPIIEDMYGKYTMDDTIIITRSNKRANLYNQQVRVRILGYEDEINSGDRMMVLRNTDFWLTEQHQSMGFIANGDTIQIKRILKFEERGNFRFCKAIIELVDYPELPELEVILLCNPIYEETPALSSEKMRELWNLVAKDYGDLSFTKMRKQIQQDPYYNAIQVKFAYAITCHKSQGGQWSAVFIDPGFVAPDTPAYEWNRWMYTAMTRSKEKVFLVGMKEELFESESQRT
jgi:tRNA A37 threonylcarbamoyladenosine biosynthesis protein TsaE